MFKNRILVLNFNLCMCTTYRWIYVNMRCVLLLSSLHNTCSYWGQIMHIFLSCLRKMASHPAKRCRGWYGRVPQSSKIVWPNAKFVQVALQSAEVGIFLKCVFQISVLSCVALLSSASAVLSLLFFSSCLPALWPRAHSRLKGS